jgi:hypothetical protein
MPVSPVAKPAALTSARLGATAIIATVMAERMDMMTISSARKHIAQRDEGEHAERDAGLRPHGEVADGPFGDAERVSDFRKQRLAVVDVRDADRAGGKHHAYGPPFNRHGLWIQVKCRPIRAWLICVQLSDRR